MYKTIHIIYWYKDGDLYFEINSGAISNGINIFFIRDMPQLIIERFCRDTSER